MPVIGDNIAAFIPLDSGSSDYNRLWMTNSLRGVFDFDVSVHCVIILFHGIVFILKKL